MTGFGEGCGESDAAIQVTFHHAADIRRSHNRLNNPFITAKERAIAARIAAAAGGAPRDGLDIGCGEGSNLSYLREAMPGTRWAGIDFSSAKVGFAREIHGDGFALACANALALPFADCSFDLVVCRDLLHHVNWNRAGVLAEAARVTRPGGTVVVIESHGRRLLGRLFQWLVPAERGGRDSVPEALLRLAAEVGVGRLEWLEASFLTRALAFFIGWPRRSWARTAATLLYRAAEVWERAVARLRRQDGWTYMMVVVQPDRAASASGGTGGEHVAGDGQGHLRLA
ncbi:class I SAM-dependent methyltransferase [Magnetospirillum sp. UT-4]|uniref:class I SAM-dependent methyltransferase n=1 Tax=Magnetospirillum sp. UT-4 TaxID=2681467 RepID=UPI001383D3EB|nr:class I SAM-dependent methyltransferase [Magnetospirillum sp. UT-4]CAA7612147.1 Methyltransferase type 11 [Magnetospirillum sp. UT-4]